MNINLKRKKFYPVSDGLGKYLKHYQRALEIPPLYEELHRFSQLFPLFDRDGADTFWKTAYYEPSIRAELGAKLIQIYSLLKTNELRSRDQNREPVQ